MPVNLFSILSLLRTLPVVLLAVLAMVQLVGCTSDQPNTMGMDLVRTEFEVELEPLDITNTTMYSTLSINDADVPYDEQEALYLGSQGGNSSSILANFSFDDIFTEDFVDTLFTEEHITSVNLRIMVLNDYQSLGVGEEDKSGEKGLNKDFLFYQLEAPFDSTAYPGPEPDHFPEILNEGGDPDEGNSFKVSLPIYTSNFLQWVEQGGLIGFMLTEGNSTEQGFMGYASRDMRHGGSTLGDVHEDVPLGLSLQVNFDNNQVLSLESVADISTFHEISDIPEDSADGFALRTVLRSYPLLRFDYSTLPDNIFINRAVLQVAIDTLASFGHTDGIFASEIDTSFFAARYDTMLLSDLEENVMSFSGMGDTGLNPLKDPFSHLNVTTSIQRVVNDAYEGERGFIITGTELYTASYFSSYFVTAPDIYFVEYRFHGTNDPDPNLRPMLKIYYSTVDEFQGGGAQ